MPRADADADADTAADPTVHRRARLVALAEAIGCLALGLVLQVLDRTPVIDVLGSILYAALVGCLALLVAPRLRPWAVAVIAFGVSATIELFQLTGLPAIVVAAVPPARLVLGSSFDAWDLVAYLGGATLAWGLAAASQRGARARARTRVTT
ncbi:DUF2809 domain-containing protein [Agromyces sp. MMS24-JH15]|uniref:ribosomal maturation YjgA family protein n=1 Tax=Agromyces sp. MMS24-JH15 TaxID=3243765 RepID=UPI003747C553